MKQEWDLIDKWLGVVVDTELTVGVMDEEAEQVFCRGNCHSFAEAVMRLCARAEMYYAYNGEPPDCAGHVLNKIDGRWFDARGFIDQIPFSRYEQDVPPPDEHFESCIEIGPEGWLGTNWMELRAEDAMPFAADLLLREGVLEKVTA
jgi:hypothetical protein